MALAAPLDASASLDTLSLPSRNKFKTSDLPLNAAQRSSIDGLVTTIKKKGEFDSIRKKVWSEYERVSPYPLTLGCSLITECSG